MMINIDIEYLTKLGWLVCASLALGLGNMLASAYYNVGVKGTEDFSTAKFFKGFIHLLIIIYLGLSLTFNWLVFVALGVPATELVDPYILCYTINIILSAMVLNSFLNIMGVKEAVAERLKDKIS